jgi:hypothetical protein
MFIAFRGQAFQASLLATKIIASVKDLNNNFDKPNPESKELIGLLVFLWAVEQGFATLVPISDPPDTDDCDIFCQEIVDRLSPPRDASKSGRDRSLGDEESPRKKSRQVERRQQVSLQVPVPKEEAQVEISKEEVQVTDLEELLEEQAQRRQSVLLQQQQPRL